MKSFKDYIKQEQIVEGILSTEFHDEQIEAAEYFKVFETADGNFRLCIYDMDGQELGKMDSTDVDYLFAYIEENFDIDAEDIEVDVMQEA